MLEIFVGYDIEIALQRLKRDFKSNFDQALRRHSYFLSRTQRKRIKVLKATRRKKKLESRSITRRFDALRRLHDKRTKGNKIQGGYEENPFPPPMR